MGNPLLLFSYAEAVHLTDCPAGWVSQKSSCYTYIRVLRRWAGAEVRTLSIQGQLLRQGPTGHPTINRPRRASQFSHIPHVPEEGSHPVPQNRPFPKSRTLCCVHGSHIRAPVGQDVG